jgi:predicted lipoprotein with Yx(FWY)xxD motif
VKRMSIALALVVVAALAVAGCGGGSSDSASGSENAGSTSGGYGAEGGGRYGSGAKEASTESPEKTGAAVVSLGQAGDLGMVLVASNGHTLYDFEKDKGGTPACYGACAQAWPPLTTSGEAQVGNGASSGMLGTVERKDGTTQVTYAGHPLYTFVEDQKPGEANGNDVTAFGGEWYALMGNGEEPED